jgi:uncharacterized protein YcfL
MIKYLALVIVPLLATGFVSGCMTSAGTVVDSYPNTRVTANSKMLAKRLEVSEYNARKINELIQAQITVLNITRKNLQFEYRFEWKDKDGIIIDTPLTTWIPFSLAAKERSTLKAMAPSSKAEDFVLTVRFSWKSTRW